MGQSHTKQSRNEQSLQKSSSTTTVHSFKAKKYLTRFELVTLQYIFEELKSTFPDGFTCIEPKKFLEHLKLPTEVEPAAVLLFKSFSYLGSYPSCTTAGPVPLSFDAFITAFVILIGRLDKLRDHVLSESLFFQSLSVLPAPSDSREQEEQERQEEPVVIEQEATSTTKDDNRLSRGLSLAELGVDFSDLDFVTATTTTSDDDEASATEQGSEILCRDLIELFVLLLWLGEVDQTTHDFKSIRQMANAIVNNIKPTVSKYDDDLPCISHHLFCQWKDKFSPHLFKSLQSFIIKSFAYYTPGDQPMESRLLPEDKVPVPDATDILSSMYCTLLSWTLPENILITKKWTRLYSADQDGFSMNRFESHVFKYPGPTLFIIQVDAVVSSHAMLARTPSKERTWSSSTIDTTGKHQSMIIGAYITQPWKHSKHFWGSNECFLFELDPNFDIFRPITNKRTGEPNNDHYIYYHHDFGIGFGATNNHLPQLINHEQHHGFILSLQNTLQEGMYENEAYPSQPTFESATKSRKHLDFFYKFDTENIEVFGLGNEKDREKQAKEWKFDKQEAARRSGLNIRQADGQLDKELLKMAGIIDEDKRQDR